MEVNDQGAPDWYMSVRVGLSCVEVKLREAADEDLPGLKIVRRQAIEHGFTDEYDREDFANLVAGDDLNLPDYVASDDHLVAVLESEVTVFAYGVFDQTNGRVMGIYTAPEYEREGWGTRLLNRFEEIAREGGDDALTATVPRNAQSFFEANGFRVVDEAQRNGLPALEMRKLLTSP